MKNNIKMMDIDMINAMNTTSDEDYVIRRAKEAFQEDPISGKAWMITAKTLYPNNFAVQFEAYHMEKHAGQIKEAARCFSDLIGKFHQQPEFWNEINKLTAALRPDADASDQEKSFYCDMFKHIAPEIQHKLLLITADHCEDTMEHCKLLLLLLQKFPSAIQTHALGLIETLLSAEKHSHAGNQPINSYRKMLVYELIPLLNEGKCTVDVPQKLVFKLLHKAIEFYVHTLNVCNTGQTVNIDESWCKLCMILEFTGKQLSWEPFLTSFTESWSKELYWQKLLTFGQSQSLNLDDPNIAKQLLYCVTIFFIHCLHEYKISLAPEPHPGQPQMSFILLEAFTDSSLPSPTAEPKAKRRKGDADSTLPYVTVEKPELKPIVNNFTLARKCWELINSAESLQREYTKLNVHLKLTSWLHSFMVDYSLYKGQVDEALSLIQQSQDLSLANNLRCAAAMYLKKNFLASYNHILNALELLTNVTQGNLSELLLTGGIQRHLHFLPITRQSVLQYCSKLLVRAISEKGNCSDVAIGNMMVLTQLDWPQEEDKIPPLLENIRQRGAFQYYLFQNYVINVDILEELSYFFTRQISLDILPHLGQRRMGTRGADKGVKEEIRQAIRRQVARCNEPLDQLTMTFILTERDHISQSLL